MRVRTATLLLAHALAVPAGAASAQGFYGTSFDSFGIGTAAEDLAVPGVTFTATPAGSFSVQDSAYAGLPGGVLARRDGIATLDVTFPPVRTVSFLFGMSAPVGQTRVVAEAFDGDTVVARATQATVTGSSVGAGFVLLTAATPFRRLRISSASDVAVAMAIDALFAYENAVCVPPTAAPVLTTPASTPIVSGRPFALEWQPVLDLAAGGSYVVETSFVPSFSTLDAAYVTGGRSALVPTAPATTIRTLYARVRAVQACGQTGPDSAPLALTVTVPPAAFVATSSVVSLAAAVGTSPAGSVRFRNVGGVAGTLALSVNGGFQLDRGSVTLEPGAEDSILVRGPATVPGLARGTLTGSYGDGNDRKVTVPLSLVVTAAAAPPGSRTGTRVTPSTSTVVFSAAPGSAPAPRTITLAIGPVTGTGTVTLVPGVGPGGAWLGLSGDLGRPLDAPGTVTLTLSVNRSLRSADEGIAPLRTLLTIRADGASDDDVAVIEVLDVEPGAVGPGAGRRSSGAGVIPPPGGASFLVPSAVKATGRAGAVFGTDGWLRNAGATSVPVELTFTPDGKDGLSDPAVLFTSRVLPAGSTLRLSEFLPGLFGAAETSGQVEVRSQGAPGLTLRTSVESVTDGVATSRYGTEIPTVSYGAGAGLGDGELAIPGVDDDATHRTNLILAETTGNPATVEVTLMDGAGQVLGKTSASLPPYGKRQLDGLVKAIAPGAPLTGGWAGVTVTAGAGRFVPVATVIDDRSNSFSAVKGRAPGGPETAGARLVVPSAARLTGAHDTRYTTDLAMVNGGTSPAALTLTYHLVDTAGAPGSVARTVVLPPRGSLPRSLGADVIASLFGVTAPSYGWIAVEGDVSRIVATAGISALVDPDDPSLGVKTSQVDGILATSPDVLVRSGLERRFAGAEKSARRRTNLILVEVAGQPCDVLVTLNGAAGSPLARRTFRVEPERYLQINDLFGPDGLALGDGPFQDVEVTARVVSGEGRIVAVATVIDNVSRNPEVFVLKPAGPPSP